jgi:transmembrane sensor
MDGSPPERTPIPNPRHFTDESAARWFARRDRGLTASEEVELREWLAEDPGNAAALSRAGETWAALALLEHLREEPPLPNPDLLAARRRPAAIVPLCLAAAAALVIGLGLWLRSPSAIVRYAATETGSRYVLPDGSVAELNRGSEISMSQNSGERRIDLLHGEAHFTVRKVSGQSFVVRAGAVAIRDLGTAFDVRMEADGVSVLVTEGRVAVTQGPPAGAPALVTAGELATIRPHAIDVERASLAQMENMLAWKGRRIVFANTPLAEAVSAMNRYNQRQFVIGDAETGAILVGGSFQVDNVDGFVRLLQDGFGVTAEARADGEIVLRKSR